MITIRKANGTTLNIADRNFDISTSLPLPGKDTSMYAETINSNLLHLLEHFNDDLPPINAVQGQLWYNSKLRYLQVLTANGWQSLGEYGAPILPDGYISSMSTAMAFSGYLSTYDSHMRGYLRLCPITSDINDNAAISKEYIDSIDPPKIEGFIPLTGNHEVPVRPIYVKAVDDYTDDSVVVNKRYADATIPGTSKFNGYFYDGTLVIGKVDVVRFTQSQLTYILGEGILRKSIRFIKIRLNAIGDIHTNSIHISSQDLTSKLECTMDGTTVVISRVGKIDFEVKCFFTIIGISNVLA